MYDLDNEVYTWLVFWTPPSQLRRHLRMQRQKCRSHHRGSDCSIAREGQSSLKRYQRQTIGRLPSLQKRPEGSFVTGILAEANAEGVMPCDTTGCYFIHIAWRPHVSTCDPHRQVCAAQRPRPSRKATATVTAWSSRRRLHAAIGSANSQSPLCLAAAAASATDHFCSFRLSHGQP